MPDKDPLTGVPPSRHPFQFWALFAAAFSGAVTAFGVSAPATLREVMPALLVTLWGWTSMVGGLLGITAGWWPDRITGLLLERVALGSIGGTAVIYGGVLFGVGGPAAVYAACYFVSIGIASGWRIKHVNRELRILTRWIERNF